MSLIDKTGILIAQINANQPGEACTWYIFNAYGRAWSAFIFQHEHDVQSHEQRF